MTRPFMFRKVMQNTLLVLFGAGTAIVGLEVVGRVLPADSLPGSLPIIVQTMRLHADTLFSQDPHFHYISKPGVDILFQHPEFAYHVSTKLDLGEAGFRGGTRGGPAWGLAFGDSFTFGLGVEHDSTWIAHLANHTRKEILNLGVAGWGPQQYTRALERFGPPLKPKVVFYALYRNDLQDALRFDRWSRENRSKQVIESFLSNHSITFNLVRLMAARSHPGVEDILLDRVDLKFSSKNLEHGLADDRNSFAPAWSITKSEIERAIHYSQKMKAVFVLLYLPSKEEAYWEQIKQKVAVLESYDGSVELLRSSITDFCKAREIHCLDLTPAFRLEAARGTKLYYARDSHMNKAGNRIAAEEIARYLLAKNVS